MAGLLLRDPAFDDPRSGGIGACAVGFAIEISQSDRIAQFAFSFSRECADIFGETSVLAFHRRPEIVEAREVHANGDHAVADIVEAGIPPGAREIAWSRHWPRASPCPAFDGALIQHRGGIPEHAE